MRRKLHALEVISGWFQILGVDFVAAVQRGENNGAGVAKAFDACKAEAKVNFKQLAFDTHPDRGGDTDAFKQLTEVWNQLQHIEVRAKPRPLPITEIQVQVTVQHFGGGYGAGTTTW